MKIIKYIFLLIFLAAIAGAVFIATQNGKYDVTKERIIKVPKNVLYNYINDYKNWENAGILTGSDTTAVFSFAKTTFGEGASANWELNGTAGEIKTLRLIENDSIFQKAVIDNEESDVVWAFKDTLNATKVTLTMTGHLTFTEKAYALLKGNIEDKLGPTLEKGLANINAFLVDELENFDVKVHDALVIKKGTYYIGQSATCKIADMEKKMAQMMPKVLAFAKENKMVPNGSPFTLYKAFDTINGTTTFKVCVPLKEEMFAAPGSEFEGGRIQDFTALKTTLTGDYSHLKKAWEAAYKHIAQKQLVPNASGQAVEVYTKNIQKTKRPSQWVTDIYIPLGDVSPIPPPVIDTTMVVDPALPPEPLAKPAASGTAKPGTTTQGTVKPAATGTGTTTATKPAATGTTAKPATATTKPAATQKPKDTAKTPKQ